MARDIQKRFTAKAEATNTPGEFKALVSVFGNIDSQGDIVDKGAFAVAIDKYAGDDNMPVVWSHQWHDLNAYLGTYKDMEETDEGLLLVGQLDIDESESALRAYQLMKNRRIKEFSFGGRVTREERVEVPAADGQGKSFEYHLKEIDLWEAGPTFKGANSETQLLSVKSLHGLETIRDTLVSKEGRVLAQKHVDGLVAARDGLDEVIKAVQKPVDDETKSDTEQNSGAAKAVTLDRNVLALLALSQINK